MATTAPPDPHDISVASPQELAVALRRWLGEHRDELGAFSMRVSASLEDQHVVDQRYMAVLHAAGWTRWGWPTWCGGSGGTAEHRAAIYEELARFGLRVPDAVVPIDTLVAPLLRFAPHLAEAYVPGYLAGREHWCQAFSEPEAGSDLTSLRLRATRDGDGWRLNGQKIWPSRGHIATKCTVLARTGSQESRHRGLTLFFVDTDTPGLTVRPIKTINGRNELSEMFFDDVVVPADRIIGEVDGAWTVAVYMLQWERGMYGWIYQGKLHHWLDYLIARCPAGDTEVAARVGEAQRMLSALRLSCRATVRRLARDEDPGPEISRDKVLLSLADQHLMELTRRLLSPFGEMDDSDDAQAFRATLFFARAGSIMGGTLEMQRNTLAEMVLGLPRAR